MATTKKPGLRERRAARFAPGAPKRVCKTPDCSIVLSKFNDDEICSRCYNAIPINERPYSHRGL